MRFLGNQSVNQRKHWFWEFGCKVRFTLRRIVIHSVN